MKRFSASILLVVFTLNTIGVYPLLDYCLHQHRSEMKTRVLNTCTESEMDVLVLSDAEYNALAWYEKHEFMYKGKMYDLSRSVVLPGGQHKLVCLNDAREEQMFSCIKSSFDDFSNGSNKQKNKAGLFLKLISLKVIPIERTTCDGGIASQKSLFSGAMSSNKPASAHALLHSPPPEATV